jgi:hypothetical protein
MALIGNDQQVGLGRLLRRFVPDRGRRYLQAALLMGYWSASSYSR